jgi:urease subunit alpha
VLGPQVGGKGGAPPEISVAFVSSAAAESEVDLLPTARRRIAVRGTRGIGLPDMHLNNRTGGVRVDPATGAVTLDGDRLTSSPADTMSLSRLYFL